jgi:type IV secretion system protein TrbL
MKNGVTGEWDGTTWREVDAAAPEGSGAGVAAAGAGAAAVGAIPAALAGAKRLAEEIATNPKTGKAVTKLAGPATQTLMRRAAPLAAGMKLYQGDLPGAAGAYLGGAALNAAVKRAPAVVLRLAGAAATRLPAGTAAGAGATAAAPFALGAGLGAAVPAAALAAIERDANRRPTIDPTRNTPASAIFRGFQTMAGRR